MFSVLFKSNFNLWVPLIFLSANAFNLEQSKILSFGKELKLYHTQKVITNDKGGPSDPGTKYLRKY